jgi:hypothetical protein
LKSRAARPDSSVTGVNFRPRISVGPEVHNFHCFNHARMKFIKNGL